jgi:hypothetical protein
MCMPGVNEPFVITVFWQLHVFVRPNYIIQHRIVIPSFLTLDNSLIEVIDFIMSSTNIPWTNNTTVLSVLLNFNKDAWRQIRSQSNIIVTKYSRLAFYVCGPWEMA